MSEDAELLRRYSVEHSEAAFAELIRRHVDLVYSAALRLVNGDAHRAQDITQQVFAEFARQAKRLLRHPAPVGWLYTTTRLVALRTIRTEQRRSAREQEANTMNELLQASTPDPDWARLRPVLEDAMHELGDKDRHAVLLRFFQNKSLKEVGMALDLGESAARMRVDRALEKLRAALLRRGLVSTATLASVIAANAVQVAPAGLAAALTTTSMVSAGTGAFALLKIMTATQLKLTVSAIVVAGAATAMVVQHQTQTQPRGQVESLTQQLAQSEADNTDLSNRLATTAPPAPMSGGQTEELLRLRGEVGILRKQAGQLAQLRAENERLQAALASAAKASMESPRGPAVPADPVEQHRIYAVNAAKMIGIAMRVFGGDNNDQYPTNFEQMKNELGNATNSFGDVKLDDFELVNVGVPNLEQHPTMIALRQKNPLQNPDGSWYRIYGLADGSVQTVESPDGNFDAWEKQNTEMPVASQ
jgi:RNA polymerase sigma factor (sigma-70 family)